MKGRNKEKKKKEKRLRGQETDRLDINPLSSSSQALSLLYTLRHLPLKLVQRRIRGERTTP